MVTAFPRSRGTTMIELMVVLVIFFSMMAVIMSFYVVAQQANTKHQQVSEEYRAAVQAALRIESLLQFSRIYEVRPTQVIYASPKIDQGVPEVKWRWPTYEPATTTLWVDSTTGRLMTRQGYGPTSTVMTLWTGQKLSFSGGIPTVTITIEGQAAVNRQPFNLTHDVHIENQGTL